MRITPSPIILFLIAAVTLSCRPAAAPVSISNRPASVNDVKVYKPFAEMTWVDEKGTVQTLKDLEGKAVVLDFWATYCIPCKEEIPHLNQLQARYGPEKLEVIGMHAGGEEDRPKIPKFRNETPMDYRLAYPEDDLIGLIFGTDSRIPQTVVIDRSGKMIKKIVGFNESIKKELDEAVEQAVMQ